MHKTLVLPAFVALTLAAGPAAAECNYHSAGPSARIYLLDPLRDPVPLDAVQHLLPPLDDPPPATRPRQEHVGPEVIALRNRLAEALVRRLDEADRTDGFLIRTLGDGRILAQVPETDRGARMLIFWRGQTGFFHVVGSGDIAATAGPGEIVASSTDGASTYLLDADPILTNEHVAESSVGFHPQTGQPVVDFRLDDAGRELFAAFTTRNVGEIIAIVLDGKVLTAPRISSPILGGAGFIEGNFNIDQMRATAVFLRSEPLPAPVRLLGSKVAGPIYRNGAIENAAVLIEFALRRPADLQDICNRLRIMQPADISIQQAESSRLLVWVELSDGHTPEEIAQAAADALGGIADLFQVERAGPNLVPGPKGILGNIRKWFD